MFNSNTDVHTVASLLKLYLRELPEPVVPFNKYTEFLSTAQLLTKDKEEVCVCVRVTRASSSNALIQTLMNNDSDMCPFEGDLWAGQAGEDSSSGQLQPPEIHLQVNRL